jgi:chaperonin cofactor prefoldin
MKSKISDKILKYHHLYDVMENNLDEWSKIDQFKTSYDEFVRNLKKLNKLNIVLEKDFSAPVASLENLKKDLNASLLPIFDLLELYAGDNNKKNLNKKISKFRRDLDKLAGSELTGKIDQIGGYAEKKLKKAEDKTKKIKALEGYGLSLGMIEELKKEKENYLKNRESLKTELKELKKTEKEIKKIFCKNDQIINKRLKKFMSMFKNSDPEFYNDFKNALKKVKLKAPESEKEEPANTILQDAS